MPVASPSSAPQGPGLESGLKQQRKLAYEGLAAPLERLSVKQIVDFRDQDTVSRPVQDGAEAAACLLAEVDNSLTLEMANPVAARTGSRDWSDARKVMAKPGHYINAMRRFPYAVDSGRIPDEAIASVKSYVESGASPEPSAHQVAHQTHDWLHSAYQYFQLRRPAPSAPASSTPNVRATPAAPSSGYGRVESNGRRIPAAARGAADQVTRSMPGGSSSSTATRPQTAATLREPQSATPKSYTSAGVRPMSAHPRPVQLRPHGHSIGSNPRTDFSSMSTEARRIALGGLPEYEIELEQMRREVRELKSQEAKARWDLKRQEKRSVRDFKKHESEELRQWRAENDIAMKKIMDAKREDARKKDLLEARDLCEFRKERRTLEKEEEKKRIEENYNYNKDHANFRAELKEKEKREGEERAVFNAEKVALERQLKKEKALQEKAEREKARDLDRRLEIEKMKRDLQRQKEELTQQVQFTQSRMGDSVKSDVWF
mmetsp:Transcript_10171/g.24994  ORF Transcript_10171/g.24994 Transcript_10171/m.24994 type:complete len:489 (+) Transcript_10171:142-1608(+)|eukprot:CAMPEP_0178996398 /NCGR_PEP_ID=MMETSP0795-20121207/8347_1 /TAXON_ID=88552 /ORGANISM="Amoebophrya sp., Strain Ameob2" /LENGTH=488 /DNA_ID=CAMNT_0020688785 /DNA_START=57 /DNA_END=1523 /DNA_ORIENTATION=+